MIRKSTVFILLAVAASIAGGVGLYQLGMRHGMDMPGDLPGEMPPSGSSEPISAASTVDPSNWGIAEGEAATRRHLATGLRAGQLDPVTGRIILRYQDPMVPGNRFDSPGKSPYMDMYLVPVYASGAGGRSTVDEPVEEPGVTISSRMQQNIGLRTTEVRAGNISPTITAVGAIAWNEREQVNVQSRALAYVEKLHVQATFDRVSKGQPLLQLHVPDWVAVQEEFLALRQMQAEGLEELVDASVARMRQAGMDEAQIRQVQNTGQLQTRLNVTAPISGVVTELLAREGMTIAPGTTLMRINGLDTVWANAELPESQASLIQPGTPVVANSPAFPGVTFEGQVQLVLPQVDAVTRTIKARMELSNQDQQLVPGMFVEMRLNSGRKTNRLLVPSEALIRTGTRTLVMVAEEQGQFRPAEVITGLEAEGQTEILQGLQEGQRIVLSGQFLVDSEASLRGVEARLGDASRSTDADERQ